MTDAFTTEPLELTKPPIVEVGFGVQFAEVEELDHLQFGRLWERAFREQFPIREVRAPLPSLIETYPLSQLGRRLQLRFADVPPIPRFWLIDQQRTGLVQVQTDRIVYNWRRISTEQPYPRYAQIREQFERAFAAFARFVEEELGATLVPNHAELVYVNRVYTPGGLPDVVKVEGLLPGIPGTRVEHRTCGGQYARFDEEDQFLGRLYIEADERLDDDLNQFVHISLAARGPLPDGNFSDFFELGHEWILNTFNSWTRETIQENWRG